MACFEGCFGNAFGQKEGVEMKRSNEKKLRMALVAFVLGALTMPTVSVVRAETYTGSDTVTVDAETKEIKVKNMTQVEQDATGAEVYSISLGKQATANGQYALAVGAKALADADNASAFGFESQATKKNASAIGSQNDATGVASSAVGFANEASGMYDTALGHQNQAKGTIESGSYNVAVGSLNIASGSAMASAVGYSNEALNDSSSAFGYDNTASGSSSSAIGASNTAEGNQASAVGYNNEAKGYRASSVGMWNEANVKLANAFGYYNVAEGENSSAFGVVNKTGGKNSSAMGRANTANGEDSSAFGRSNEAIGAASSAVGYANKVYGANAAAFGYTNTVGADGATTGAGTYVFGASNTVTANNAIVLGANVTTVADNSVVIGDQSTSEDANTVSVGYTGGERKIVHVADGTANTDAATYGQIAKTEQAITLSTDTRDTVNEKDIKGNEIAANDGTVLATFTKVGETLTANDTGFVSGGDLYTEVRPVDGTIVKKASTTAANLKLLEKAIEEKVYDGDSYITVDNTNHKISLTVNGVIEDGHSGLLTGDTVYDYLHASKLALGYKAEATGVASTAIGNNVTASDTSATAVGHMSNAKSAYAAAFGYQNGANSSSALAMGSFNNANAEASVAVGNQNTANATKSSAIGVQNRANGNMASAVGYNNQVTKITYGTGDDVETAVYSATAMGVFNKASSTYATAVGVQNIASGELAVSMGIANKTGGVRASAVGVLNEVYGEKSGAFGYYNIVGASKDDDYGNLVVDTTKGTGSYVFGGYNRVTANNAIVLGTNVTTVADNSVVIGDQSTSEDANTVSVGYTGGERKIVHVADGTANTDAATYGQIAKTEQAITLSTDTRDTVNEKDIKGNEIAANDGTVLATFTKVGETLTANDTGFVSGGDLYAEVRPTGSKKVDGVGDYEYIDKDQTTAQNLISLDAAIAENKYQGSDTISIAKADGDTVYTVKVKNMAMSEEVETAASTPTAVGLNAIAFGAGAKASGDYTMVLGHGSEAEGEGATALGADNNVKGQYSVAIGTMNTASSSGGTTSEGTIEEDEVALNAAIGAGNYATGSYYSSAVGVQNSATAAQAVAYGYYNQATGEGASAVGGANTVSGMYATAVGSNNVATGQVATAIGYGNQAVNNMSMAIGTLATATGEGATAIGYQAAASVGPKAESGNTVLTVSFGHDPDDIDPTTLTEETPTGTTYGTTVLSRLTHVADGKSITDAANFGQIAKTGQTVNLGTTTTTVNGKTITANQVAANNGTVLATFTKVGETLTASDMGFVSGADLYKEVRPVDGDIVKNGMTTAENLKALEEALAGNAYQGSDTISISKAEGDTAYTVKVKNMAMSEEVEAAASAPTAVGLNAIAFGAGSKASGDYTMVLGHGSEAEGEGATALGADNNVKGQYSVAIGTMNTASSSGGTTSEGTIEEDEVALNAAIGAGNYATGSYYSSAVGVQNSATAAQAVAYGYYNQATGEGASAVGGANTVSGMYATAVGSNNVATGQVATAIGYGNQAVNNMSMAIGTLATATGEGATAIGYQAAASVGPKAESGNTVLTVSFGHDPDDIDPTTLTEETPTGTTYGTTVLSRLTHVADGKSITDAANFGQIAKTGQTVNLGTTTTTVNGKTITANQVAANNGTVLATFTKVGDTLTASDMGFVSGADLYKETREEITSTNYIAKGNTAGANLNALAEKIGEEKGVTDVYDATDTVENQIYKVANTRVAKDQTVSLATTSGTNATNVIKDADGNVLVTMAAGTVSSGNNNFVSGGQVWANDVKNQSYDVQGDGTVTIKNNANGTAFTITGIGSGSSIVIGDGAESAHWVDLVWNGAVDDDNVTRGMNSAAYGYQANASGEAATALGYNAQAGGVNSVALGSGSVAEEDEVVSVGGGDVATRRIINVANGTSNSDAATYGQTFKAATVELTSTKNTITSHDGETTVTFKMGAVSNNNTGFISGGQLYTEGRVKGNDYHALDKANTIAQNLEALDAALGNNTSMVVGDEDTHALDISWNQESGEAAGRGTNSAAYGYQANASGEAATALGYNAQAGGTNSVALGSGSVAEEDNVISVGGGDVETRKIVNVAYGADSHDAAAVGQLIAGASNATSTDKTKAQTATLTFKDTTQTALTIEVPGQGTVDASDQRLVSGATLYGETRNAIATTNQTLHYVSEQDAANNLLALDKAIGKAAKGKYISAQDGDSVTVATNLAELDQALKDFDETRNGLVSYDQTGKQIQIGSGVDADTISAGARRITNVMAGTADTDAVNKKQLDTAIAGTNYTAGNAYVTVDNAARTISVDVSGAVSSGDTGIVTGGTVYNSIVKNATYSVNSDKKTVTVKNGANQTAFTLDLDGLADEGVTYEAGNYISISDANQISVDVAGSVSSGNTGIVTGGTVYNSIVKNATYSVNSDKKTVTVKNGANQTAFTLDLSGLPSGSGSGVTYEAGDHISISSDNKISVTADGAVAKNNSGLVTGGTVYDAIQTQIGQITPYTGDDETIAVTDKKISAKTGEIGSGVKTLVTGDTAYQALVKNETYSLNDDKKTITVKNGADQTAFTLNLDGLAGGSGTTYEAGDHISISSDNVISVKTDGKIESGNTGIVTGGAIYEKVGDTTKLSEAGLGENLTDSVLNVNSRIGTLDNDISKAGAGAAALAALRPEAFNPSDKVSFALGYGHYRGTSAGAFGAFYKPNADTTLSVGATIGNSDSMMNAGISFKLGSRGQGLGLYSPNVDLVRQVNALRVDNELLKADNARMKQQIALILANMEMSGTVRKSVKE